MSDIRDRVWRRLFGSKGFVIPAAVAVGTGSIAILSGGVWIAISITFAAIAIGGVILKVAAGAEQLEQQAVDEIALEKWELEERRLKDLQRKLRSDRDFRTKDCYNLAVQARDDFTTIVKSKPGLFADLQFSQQFEQLFWATIEQLEHSVQLYEQADRLVDARRLEILKQRDQVVAELFGAAERLRQVLRRFRSTSNQNREADLGTLTRELTIPSKLPNAWTTP